MQEVLGRTPCSTAVSDLWVGVDCPGHTDVAGRLQLGLDRLGPRSCQRLTARRRILAPGHSSMVSPLECDGDCHLIAARRLGGPAVVIGHSFLDSDSQHLPPRRANAPGAVRLWDLRRRRASGKRDGRAFHGRAPIAGVGVVPGWGERVGLFDVRRPSAFGPPDYFVS